jgi:hypothetical protein
MSFDGSSESRVGESVDRCRLVDIVVVEASQERRGVAWRA